MPHGLTWLGGLLLSLVFAPLMFVMRPEWANPFSPSYFLWNRFVEIRKLKEKRGKERKKGEILSFFASMETCVCQRLPSSEQRPPPCAPNFGTAFFREKKRSLERSLEDEVEFAFC